MPADPGSTTRGPTSRRAARRRASAICRPQPGRRRCATAHGNRVTFSPKVFIPLTMLCRDRCGYCTFAKAPARLDSPYLVLDEVLAIARAGRDAGCHEALFTLGEGPEDRYPAARALARRPRLHLHRRLPGGRVPGRARGDRAAAPRQRRRPRPRRPGRAAGGVGQPGDDDRVGQPRPRRPPFGAGQDAGPTTGHPGGGRAGRPSPSPPACWSGIGESRADRLATLEAIAASHRRHGHVQEVIVQNFLPKAGHVDAPRPAVPDRRVPLDHRRRPARCCPPTSTCRRPPTSPTTSAPCSIRASTTGAGSPRSPPTTSTPSGPGRPSTSCAPATEAAGHTLAPRLTLYPEFALDPERWLDRADALPGPRRLRRRGPGPRPPLVLGRRVPSARAARRPRAPALRPAPAGRPAGGHRAHGRSAVGEVLAGVGPGEEVGEDEIVTLFGARGPEVRAVAAVADAAAARHRGRRGHLRGQPQHQLHQRLHVQVQVLRLLQGPALPQPPGQPVPAGAERDHRPGAEAEALGATEVCLQGGIHPKFDGDYYLEVIRAVREASATIHIHGFTALEVTEGARRSDVPLADYLSAAAGRRAARPCRARPPRSSTTRSGPILCPDKINTEEWLVRPPDRPQRRAALQRDHHVRGGGAAPVVGPPPGPDPGPPAGDRRVHRVRPPPLRAHGHPHLPPAPVAPGPDLPRDPAHARRGPDRLPGGHRQHPDQLGEDGAPRACARSSGPASTTWAAPSWTRTSPGPPGPATAR